MRKIQEFEVWREGGIFGEEIRIVITGDYERGSDGGFDEPPYAEGFIIGSAVAHMATRKYGGWVGGQKSGRVVELDILPFLEADDIEYDSIAQEIIDNHFGYDDGRGDWEYEQAKDRKLENRE